MDKEEEEKLQNLSICLEFLFFFVKGKSYSKLLFCFFFFLSLIQYISFFFVVCVYLVGILCAKTLKHAVWLPRICQKEKSQKIQILHVLKML